MRTLANKRAVHKCSSPCKADNFKNNSMRKRARRGEQQQQSALSGTCAVNNVVVFPTFVKGKDESLEETKPCFALQAS